MLKKLAVGGIITISTLSFGLAAHASLLGNGTINKAVGNTTQTVTGAVGASVNSTANATNATVSSVCDQITPKVDSKISDFNKKFDTHLSYYKDQRQKVQLLVNGLNAKGVDTSKLRADLVLFDLKQKKFESDKSSVLDNLNLIKTDKCAGHMISAASDLTAAVSSEKTLKTDTNDLLNFLNTNIQNDINSLRS
jgi:hypothetical protein